MTDAIPHGPLPPVPFSEVAVLDTETTGLCPQGISDNGQPSGDPDGPDRLCSIAARLWRRDDAGIWSEERIRSWLVDPLRPVPEGAARVNGFTWVPGATAVPSGRCNLAGSQPIATGLAELMAFVGNRPLVCHNTAFDASVLDAELARAGLPLLAVPLLCTKKAFSAALGLGRPHSYVPGTNLNRLCDILGVDRSGRVGPDGAEQHGANVDALMAAHCFSALDALGWMVTEDASLLPHRRG